MSRREVDRITSEKGLGAAQYLKFFSLRRVTEHACQCVPFLKFGYCRHVFAVQFRIHGLKIVPHGVISGHVPRVADSDEDSEVGAGEGDDAESSDSAPDNTEDEIAPPMYSVPVAPRLSTTPLSSEGFFTHPQSFVFFLLVRCNTFCMIDSYHMIEPLPLDFDWENEAAATLEAPDATPLGKTRSS